MLLSRSLKIIFIILVAAVPCALGQKAKAQKGPPCPVNRVPEMRGFRLGMPLTEVKGALEDASLFDSKISGGNKVGSRAVRVLGSELKGDNAEGVDDVDLVFVDDRLASMKINFNSAMRWEGAQDFFARTSESLGIPKPVGEEASNQRNQKYVFECQTFSVTLAYAFGVSPSVAITDMGAQRTIGERYEKNPDGETREIFISPGRPTQTKRPPPPPPR